MTLDDCKMKSLDIADTLKISNKHNISTYIVNENLGKLCQKWVSCKLAVLTHVRIWPHRLSAVRRAHETDCWTEIVESKNYFEANYQSYYKNGFERLEVCSFSL